MQVNKEAQGLNSILFSPPAATPGELSEGRWRIQEVRRASRESVAQERCLRMAGALPRGSEQLRMCRNFCAVSKPRTPSGTMSAQAFRLGEATTSVPFPFRWEGLPSPHSVRAPGGEAPCQRPGNSIGIGRIPNFPNEACFCNLLSAGRRS